MATLAHVHRTHSGDDLVAAAQAVLARAGEKWTETRAAVYAALVAVSGPTSAYDIAEAVGRRLGRRIAPNSIYRILDLFLQHNLVLRLESRKAYVANIHPGCVHDCIFLVCESCGAVAHSDDDAVADAVGMVVIKHAFQPARSVIEVMGRCKSCATA